MISVSASAPPLKGMLVELNPALSLNRSALRCTAEPIPSEAKFDDVGLALECSTYSFAVLKPLEGATIMMFGTLPIAPTVTKSLVTSYDSTG